MIKLGCSFGKRTSICQRTPASLMQSSFHWSYFKRPLWLDAITIPLVKSFSTHANRLDQQTLVFRCRSRAFACFHGFNDLGGVSAFTNTRSRGIVFWADIATYTNSADFTSTVLTMGSEEITAELTQHIYDIASTICAPKFRYVSLAIWFSLLGTISLGTSLFFENMWK